VATLTTDAPLRLEWLMPDSLDPNPLNWRKHPPQQTNAMDALLFGEDGVGWAGVLLYNEETGRLIDGHLRQELALKRNDPVPVLIGSWTEAQEKKILATFDPIAGMAQTDKEALDALLRDVEASDPDVMAMLSEMAEGDLGEAVARNEQTQLGNMDDVDNERQLGARMHLVKLALYVPQVAVVEKALLTTGNRNRGEALMEICEAYLGEKGQFDIGLQDLSEDKLA